MDINPKLKLSLFCTWFFLCVCLSFFVIRQNYCGESSYFIVCASESNILLFWKAFVGIWLFVMCHYPQFVWFLTLNMCIKLHAVSEYIVRLTDKPLNNLRYFVSCWLDYCKAHYVFVIPCPEIMQLLWWHLLRQSYDSLVIWARERLIKWQKSCI